MQTGIWVPKNSSVRQGDHAVHRVALDHRLADFTLAAAVGTHRAIGEDHGRVTGGREVVVDVLEPCVVGVSEGRHAEFPTGVIPQELATPLLDVEGRVREVEIEAHVREGVLEQRAFVVPAEVAGNTPDREVHAGEPEGFRVPLLPIHGYVIQAPGVSQHEAVGLDVESARAVAAIVDAAPVGFDHVHHQRDHAARRVLLAARLALHRGELAEEELIDATEEIEVVRHAREVEIGEVVDQPAEHLGAEVRLAEDFGQHPLEFVVLTLDGPHGVVQSLPDIGGAGMALERLPACLQRHPEDVVSLILLVVLRVGMGRLQQFSVLPLEGGGQVAQEHQTKANVHVVGRRDSPAHLVGRVPELDFEGLGRCGSGGFSLGGHGGCEGNGAEESERGCSIEPGCAWTTAETWRGSKRRM